MCLSLLKKHRHSTGFRLTIGYAVLFMFSSLILFGIGYLALSRTITNKDHQIVLEKINTYTNIAERSGLPSLVQELERTRTQNERSGFFVRVVDRQRQVVTLTLPSTWRPIPVELYQTALPFVEDEWVTIERPPTALGMKVFAERDALDIAGRLLRDGTVLQVGYSTHARKLYLGYYQGTFLVIIGPIIVFGIVVGAFLSHRGLKPVHDLTLATKSVRAGRMDARVPVGETDNELKELAQQFNAMLDSLATLMNGMREALDNVAHDLRTPLTRMRASIESAMQTQQDAASLREALLDCAEESQQIMNMLNTLMDISEAETGVMQLNLKELDLRELVESIHELYSLSAEEKTITLEEEIPPGLMVYADAGRLRQALSNLVDNAVKYTPPGGHIMIAAQEKIDGVHIVVTDSGMGIADSDIPRIFERLYRGDKSRSQRGLGLGLCLVKAIAAAHSGTIAVQSMPGKGASFTLVLPIKPPLTT